MKNKNLILFQSRVNNFWYGQKSKDACRRTFDIVAGNVGVFALYLAKKKYGDALQAETGGDFFYYQWRVGKNGEKFPIVKLQTMSQKRDATGALLPDAERLGPIGAKLRKWKIDELAQFANVLRGEMSTVGPRPHVINDEISCVRRRHQLLPGITGPGKLIAGNDNSHLQELKGDCRYRRNCNKMGLAGFAFYNAGIVLMTPVAILKQKNAPTSYETSGQSLEIKYKKQLVL